MKKNLINTNYFGVDISTETISLGINFDIFKNEGWLLSFDLLCLHLYIAREF